MSKAIARLRAQVDPVGLAAALLILWSSPASAPEAVPRLSGAGQGIYLALLVVCLTALVVRRRHPLVFVLVSALAMIAHIAVFTQISAFAVVVTLIAIITTQSRLVAPWRWALLGSVYMGVGLALLLAARGIRLQDRLDPAGYGPLYWCIVLGSSWTVITLAAFIGDARRRRRRERYERAIERAAVLEAQQEAERRLAVSAERNRIARGVHDAVGHSLSAIAMQAEGARAVMGADPEAANEALAVIGRTSRASIEEVRALLEVLRDDEAPIAVASSAPGRGDSSAAVGPSAGETPAAPAPVGPLATGTRSPSGPSLLGIIQEARLAGLPVALSMTTQCEAPASAADALARVTRESLANILRHAPGAATRIELWVTDSGCGAEVINDAGGPDEGPGSGLGLSGMRQRVEALGGSLCAGPRPAGGWRVAVRLPSGPVSAAVGEEQS
ncbi:histidine kinase [Actinomyces timonensis]|uniref:histidine kinase n=1 Tax=Actinomyces timonensis TaxID=1288391 RepID=A0AAU8N434_9ACTO